MHSGSLANDSCGNSPRNSPLGSLLYLSVRAHLMHRKHRRIMSVARTPLPPFANNIRALPEWQDRPRSTAIPPLRKETRSPRACNSCHPKASRKFASERCHRKPIFEQRTPVRPAVDASTSATDAMSSFIVLRSAKTRPRADAGIRCRV